MDILPRGSGLWWVLDVVLGHWEIPRCLVFDEDLLACNGKKNTSKYNLSHLKLRLWHFLSSVNLFFKRACAAIHPVGLYV